MLKPKLCVLPRTVWGGSYRNYFRAILLGKRVSFCDPDVLSFRVVRLAMEG